MSRTDKTKPWNVRVAEHQHWAEHNHENGICDLPETPYQQDGFWKPHGCYWSDWGLVRNHSCCSGCGCSTCSKFNRLRKKRGSERQAVKREIRRALLDC